MKKLIIISLLFFITCSFISCIGNGKDPGTENPPTVVVTGRWEGEVTIKYRDKTLASTYQVELNAIQNWTYITGTMSIEGLETYEVQGDVKGTIITLHTPHYILEGFFTEGYNRMILETISSDDQGVFDITFNIVKRA